MNNFAQYKVVITNHAYTRYLERVGNMEREKLRDWCSEEIESGNFWDKTKAQCIQIDDIWFGYIIETDSIFLETCLGRSHIDLPEAMKWAFRHNDRIGLATNYNSKVLL